MYEKYILLLGAFLLNLSVANFFTYNNMIPYISPEYFYHNESNHVYVFALGFVGMGSSMYLAPILILKYNHAITALLAGLFSSFNVLAMSVTSRQERCAYIITYGFFGGFGTGIVYGVSISVACKWFPKRRGTACGVVTAAFPLSSLIFGKTQIDLMKALGSPYKFDWSYFILGFVYIFIQIIGVLLLMVSINDPPEDNVSLIRNYSTDHPFEELSNIQTNVTTEPHKLIRKMDFWNLWLTYLLLTACFGFNMFLHIGFGIEKLKIAEENDHVYFDTALPWGLLMFAIGAVFWGCIIDKFKNYKIVMIIIAMSVLILTTTLPLSQKINQQHHDVIKAYYFTWVLLLYFLPSGMFSIFPSINITVFGKENMIANYAVLCTAWTLSSAVVCILISIFKSYGSIYCAGFYAGGTMSFISAVMILVFRYDIKHSRHLRAVRNYSQ